MRVTVFLGETVPPRDGAHTGTAQLPRILGGNLRKRLRELCGESIHCLTLLTGRAAPEPGKLRAAVKVEDCPAYEGPGPVLYVSKISACQKADPEVVSF